MSPPIDTTSTWNTIRTRLIAARENLDLKRSTIARRCKCARSTIDRIENGDSYTRANLLITYAHTVDKDLAIVGPHLARIATELDDSDIVAILRAASAAATAQRLNPLESRRITELLTRVLPHHQAQADG